MVKWKEVRDAVNLIWYWDDGSTKKINDGSAEGWSDSAAEV